MVHKPVTSLKDLRQGKMTLWQVVQTTFRITKNVAVSVQGISKEGLLEKCTSGLLVYFFNQTLRKIHEDDMMTFNSNKMTQ